MALTAAICRNADVDYIYIGRKQARKVSVGFVVHGGSQVNAAPLEQHAEYFATIRTDSHPVPR
jgi:hypothetical protein